MASKKNTRKKAPAKTTATKAAPKRRVASRKKTSAAVTAPSVTESKKSTTTTAPARRGFRLNRTYVVIALVVLLLAGLLYLLRSFFIAATVNGQPISRLSVVSELERQSGKQALNTLVTKTLILQEANKQHVTVSQSEIDAEVKKIEDNLKQQGQTLDQALAAQGMDKQSLEDQIRIQKLVEKMLGKDIKVSDAEVQDYINKNKDSLGSDPESQATKNQVRQQLTQQKLSDKFQTWLADLQKKAKINYYVNYQ